MARVIEQAGVSVAPTGSTGVQVNEFEAAIKSVTSATTVGAVFVYDTRNDSDSGAWRKKCQGLSWYDETLNTATRGGRREFPSVALIVADNVSNAATVSIYDLDDPSMPLWLKINAGSSSLIGASSAVYSSVTMLNGVMVLGRSTNGVYILNFANEVAEFYNNSNGKYVYNGGFVNRNGSVTYQSLGTSAGQIAADAVNDVAATVFEGAEIGALGLPIPTVAVASGGGVSVIHPNGSVYDLKDSTATNRSYSDVRFRESGDIFAWSSMNGTAHSWYAHQLYSDLSAASDLFKYDEGDNANLPNLLSDSTQTIAVGKGSVFTGGSNGLSIVKENLANPVEGASAHITSTYNTGYMLGDIRFATTTTQTANLSNGANVYDQSVKGNTLTVNAGSGSYITRTKVATDAEMSAFSGFSATEYLSRAYDSDFDFGTGDFSVSLWVKQNANTGTEMYVDRNDAGGSGPRFSVYVNTNGYPIILTNTIVTGGTVIDDNQWTKLDACRRGSTVSLYVNGKLSATGTDSATITNTSALLYIGNNFNQSQPATNASLALVRISATAPTPQQVKEIYEAERPLFREGAKCLLAANQVNDLAYDSSTNLLHVASESTSSSKSFRGLEAVESLTSDGSFGLAASKPLDYVAASGGVVAGVGGDTSDADTSGCGVNLPAIDVRGDINTADTKLPDDGKLHFSGVTTDATPTVIGHIPIAENEWYSVKARVTSVRYNNVASSAYHTTTIEETFYRAVDGDIFTRGEIRKLSDEIIAGLDVDLELNNGPHTLQIKVTGTASVDRMVWNAEVEVQRISEKQYER